MGVNPRGTLRSPERNPGTILKRALEILKLSKSSQIVVIAT
jgi:hypothetical protein